MACAMDGLPDSLLLEILRYLSLPERLLVASVCRRWRRVCDDGSFWRHLECRLPDRWRWSMLRRHLSRSVQVLKLEWRPASFQELFASYEVDESFLKAVLEDVRDRCPNIQELRLEAFKVANAESRTLPRSLVRLEVLDLKGPWPSGWMEQACLPNLQSLDLSHAVDIAKVDVEDICRFSTLEELRLNSCLKIDDICVKLLAENLASLKRLEIAGSKCTDLALQHVSRGLPNIRHLDVSDCTLITDRGVKLITANVKTLAYLDISSCDHLTGRSLQSLRTLTCLQTLVCGPKLKDSDIDQFKIRLPTCKVIKRKPIKYQSWFYAFPD